MKSKTVSRTSRVQKTAVSDTNQDAVALLKDDHRNVEEMFDQYGSLEKDEEKCGLVEQICNALVVHTHIEEEIFYPACRKAEVDTDDIDKAQVEHDAISLFLLDLMSKSPGTPFYDAKVQVLGEYVKLHVSEEEKPGSGIFAKAKAAGMDLTALGKSLMARKQQLEAMAENRGIAPSAPRTLEQNRQFDSGDNTMARYDQERDEQGRFVSDDDRGNYRQGRSSADDSRRYSRSRYEDDDRTRYARSPNDEYMFSGRGHGGWYGDPEGHSRASERGWEGRQGYDDGRSSYGRSHYEDNDRGRYSQSRSRNDYQSRSDDDRGRYSRSGSDDDRTSQYGHGGWYGDPEGHSRASELGWEHRRGDYEDDRGRYSRSRSDDDYRASPRGGHGGWYGDPEGHADAARRGWQGR